jgi:hypothetical protein
MFLAPLPKDVAGKGEFGVGVRSLIPLFKSECHLPESAILTFFSNFGIQTSAAYISNQWTSGYEQFNQEKDDIVTAAISSGSYQQIDDSGARGARVMTELRIHVGNGRVHVIICSLRVLVSHADAPNARARILPRPRC